MPFGSNSQPRANRPLVEALEMRTLLSTVLVTSSADTGAGSLRAAIEQANVANSKVDVILIAKSVNTINLQSSLGYTGAQDLSIKGNGAAVAATAGSEGAFDLLESTGGADLKFERITFRDGLKGIDIIVPSGASGVLSVQLNQVNILDNVEHGMHIDDRTNATDSALYLGVLGGLVSGNGSDPNDFDGIRVDDNGAGGITASFIGATVVDNGGDGIELDEREDGDINAFATLSRFDHNGSSNVDDLEDGFDIDEGGLGNIIANFVGVSLSNNFEGGLDLNEDDGDDVNDAGSVFANLVAVVADDNDDKGLDFSEFEDGSIVANFLTVSASRNGIFAGNLEEGIVIEEAGVGDVGASFRFVTASGNGDDGIDIDESGDGNFVGLFQRVTANDNGQEGIDADEADAGTFSITLINVVSNDPLDVTD